MDRQLLLHSGIKAMPKACILWFREYPYSPPHGRLLEIPKGRGIFKAKPFIKRKCEAKLEFPEVFWREVQTKKNLWMYNVITELSIYSALSVHSENMVLYVETQ